MHTSGLNNLLILDEPFVQMDARNAEAVVNFLTKHSGKETILLISNEEALKGLIHNRLHIVKHYGLSNLEEAT